MLRSRTYVSLLTMLVLIFGACRNDVNTNVTRDQLEPTLQKLVNESVYGSFDAVAGTSLAVYCPDINLDWSGVSGYDSKDKTDTLGILQPFRIASVSKTFVAASILRLHEMDSLSVDDAIIDYISREHIELLIKGGYNPSTITIRNCLNHTAGLNDYALGVRTFLERVMANPQKKWTRTEQLTIAVEAGQKKGEPDEKYNYSDTGYILLGETLETILDTTLAASIDILLDYDKLGLNSTWLESAEPSKVDSFDIAHCYLGRNDATEWDASIDIYGGGGLVSTSQDLAQFMFRLMNDEVFLNNATKDLMISPTVFLDSDLAKADENYSDYRLGVMQIEVFGEKAYFHDGFWGSFMIYIPTLNCSIAGYTVDGSSTRLLKKVWLTMKNNRRTLEL